MANLPFYDCKCLIGTLPYRHISAPASLSDYLADFDYYDIRAAVVHHSYAAHYSQDYGNRFLLDEIGDDPRLVPQWVVVPHWAGEMAPPDKLVAEMLSLGIRTARFYPRSQAFGTSPEVVGPLLNELQAARIPLFVDVTELDLEAAVNLARAYPNLPVVLCGVSWASDRVIFARFGEVPNLHLETSAFQGHRHYERFIAEFGSERLLFGTNLPNCSPGAARMMTDFEQISDQDRCKIAGQNLLRLLGSVRGTSARPVPTWEAPPDHPDDDPIVARVRSGKPLHSEFVLDAHAHLGHPGCMGVDQCALAYNDADGLLATMDRLGIDLTIPSSWSGITYAAADANDMTLDAVERYPGRFLAYGCLNPSYPELYQSEFERIFLTGRVAGYKPYPPRQRIPITDSRHELGLSWANEHGAPVLCHAGPADQVMQLAPLYPNAKFLIAHAGSSWDLGDKAIEAAKKYSNVYAEITYTSILYHFIEYFCEQVGPQQLIFGTDCVMRDAAPQLGWVAWAQIPLEAKRQVLAYNMADILKLPAEQRKSVTGP